MSVAPRRVHEVDGIRGWAAVMVLLFHTFVEMYRHVEPAIPPAWLAPLLSGDLAVNIFFILSGDALSNAYFSTANVSSIDRLVIRRYFRLTIPIAMSALLSCLIMVSHLDFHAAAAERLRSPDWLGRYLQFQPSLVGLMRYSLFGVYVEHNPARDYNPFLWTMSVELVGSMLVFLLCYLWARLARPWLVCAGLAVAASCVGSFFGLFFAGVLFGYWRSTGYLNRFCESSRWQLASGAILLATVLWLMMASPFGLGPPFFPVQAAVSMLLVFCFYTQTGCRRFFAGRLSRVLGEISFPLYLVHFQVLISLTSWLILQGKVTDQSHLVAIGLTSVVASVVVAVLFRMIEKPALSHVDKLILRALPQT